MLSEFVCKSDYSEADESIYINIELKDFTYKLHQVTLMSQFIHNQTRFFIAFDYNLPKHYFMELNRFEKRFNIRKMKYLVKEYSFINLDMIFNKYIKNKFGYYD